MFPRYDPEVRFHEGGAANGVFPGEPDGVVEIHSMASYRTAYKRARLYVAGCRHRYVTEEFVGTQPLYALQCIIDLYQQDQPCDCQLPTEHGPGVQRVRRCYHCNSEHTEYRRAHGERFGLMIPRLEYICHDCGRYTEFPVIRPLLYTY